MLKLVKGQIESNTGQNTGQSQIGGRSSLAQERYEKLVANVYINFERMSEGATKESPLQISARKLEIESYFTEEGLNIEIKKETAGGVEEKFELAFRKMEDGNPELIRTRHAIGNGSYINPTHQPDLTRQILKSLENVKV